MKASQKINNMPRKICFIIFLKNLVVFEIAFRDIKLLNIIYLINITHKIYNTNNPLK